MLNKADLKLSQERRLEAHINYFITDVTRARRRNMRCVENYRWGTRRGGEDISKDFLRGRYVLVAPWRMSRDYRKYLYKA